MVNSSCSYSLWNAFRRLDIRRSWQSNKNFLCRDIRQPQSGQSCSTMNFFRFTDLHAHKRARKIAEEIWQTVILWENFCKFSIGDQFVRAADSISANLAEGFGRYHKKDKIKFYYYALGSVYETEDWSFKAHSRAILLSEKYESILKELHQLPLEIHMLIKITNEKLKS